MSGHQMPFWMVTKKDISLFPLSTQEPTVHSIREQHRLPKVTFQDLSDPNQSFPGTHLPYTTARIHHLSKQQPHSLALSYPLTSKLAFERGPVCPAALEANVIVLYVLSFTADFVPKQTGQQSNKCQVVIKVVQCAQYPLLCDKLF